MQLMEAAREKDTLSFQGHRYQIFQDLQQHTLIKRRKINPNLQILQHHRISYCWSFPFAVRFSHKGTSYTCKTVDDLSTVIRDLRLSTLENYAEGSKRRTLSSSPTNRQDDTDQQTHPSTYKRSRFASTQPDPEDQRD